MNRVLEDIQCIPGVAGACFFNPQKGILAQKLSSGCNGESLAAAARILAKIYSGSESYYTDIEKISLIFNELNLVIAGVTEKIFMVISHRDEIDKNLLDMTVSQSVKALRHYIATHGKTKNDDRHETSPLNPQKQEIKPETVHDRNHASIEAAIKTEVVSQALSAMEKTLNKIMGPISAIIFNDTLRIWIKRSEDENIFSIDLLACMLFDEIGDPEKIDAYKSMIEQYIKPAREKFHAHLN